MPSPISSIALRRPRTPAMNSASLRTLFITERARDAPSICSVSLPPRRFAPLRFVAGLEVAGIRVGARALDTLNRRRAQLPSVELVDRLQQQPRIVGEVL